MTQFEPSHWFKQYSKVSKPSPCTLIAQSTVSAITNSRGEPHFMGDAKTKEGVLTLPSIASWATVLTAA